MGWRRRPRVVISARNCLRPCGENASDDNFFTAAVTPDGNCALYTNPNVPSPIIDSGEKFLVAAASSARETRWSAGSKLSDSSKEPEGVVTVKGSELEVRNGGFGEGLRQRSARNMKRRLIKTNAATAAISASTAASMIDNRQREILV